MSEQDGPSELPVGEGAGSLDAVRGRDNLAPASEDRSSALDRNHKSEGHTGLLRAGQKWTVVVAWVRQGR